MTFAEEAEKELIHLMTQNKHSAFSKLEKSNQGENMVVRFLDRQVEPVSPKFLADSLGISSARIAVVLGTLEKKNQIIRTIDKSDRRRINVVLTEEGKACARNGKKEMRDKIIKVFEQMGKEDTSQFIKMIQKFVECSKKID